MQLRIYDLFTVGVIRPAGGWSKGRPIAFIEEDDKCVPLLDLVIPNDLDDAGLAQFLSDRFAAFARPGKRIVRNEAQGPKAGSDDRTATPPGGPRSLHVQACGNGGRSRQWPAPAGTDPPAPTASG